MGVLVSVICTTLIVVVLATTNNNSLDSWTSRMPVQLNSVISILTTVGKSGMMITISACIGQFKWRYFQTKPRPLSHLQFFDDAGRGPWGAFMFFGQVKLGALVACGLALVTLLGLGIEPSAQQILEFPNRLAEMRNASASVGGATSYESKAYAPIHSNVTNCKLLTWTFQGRAEGANLTFRDSKYDRYVISRGYNSFRRRLDQRCHRNARNAQF